MTACDRSHGLQQHGYTEAMLGMVHLLATCTLRWTFAIFTKQLDILITECGTELSSRALAIYEFVKAVEEERRVKGWYLIVLLCVPSTEYFKCYLEPIPIFLEPSYARSHSSWDVKGIFFPYKRLPTTSMFKTCNKRLEQRDSVREKFCW